jgi:hypothetical protein
MRPRLQLGCRRRSPWVQDRRAGALVGLILALLVVGDLPVVHDHGAPGLYNEECPLARLDTTSPRTSVSQDPDPFPLACTPEAVPTAPPVVLAPFSPASFAPRAPPSKSPLPSRAVIG